MRVGREAREAIAHGHQLCAAKLENRVEGCAFNIALDLPHQAAPGGIALGDRRRHRVGVGMQECDLGLAAVERGQIETDRRADPVGRPADTRVPWGTDSN